MKEKFNYTNLLTSGTGGLPLTSYPLSSETGLSYEGEIQLHKFIDKPVG